MNRLGLLRRIEELRLKGGIYDSERALGVAAGVGPDFLRHIRTGKTANPGAQNLAKIAEKLDTTVDDLLEAAGVSSTKRRIGGEVADVDLVKIVGDLQAGIWREAVEWPPSRQRKIALPADSRYPNVKRFGLELVGDSMNLIYPLPKTIIICVRCLEIDATPASGSVVVVQRWHHDLVEATCKVFVERDDGTAWLEPRSSNPAYKPVRLVRMRKELAEVTKSKLPAVVQAGELDDHPSTLDKLEIAALVVGSYAEQ